MSDRGPEPDSAAARRLEIIRKSQQNMTGTNIERIRNVYVAPSAVPDLHAPASHVNPMRERVEHLPPGDRAARLTEIVSSWTDVGNDGRVRLDRRQVAEALRISAEFLDGSAAALDDAALDRGGLLEKLRPAVTLADATAEIRRLAAATEEGTDPSSQAGIRHVRIIRISAELLAGAGG